MGRTGEKLLGLSAVVGFRSSTFRRMKKKMTEGVARARVRNRLRKLQDWRRTSRLVSFLEVLNFATEARVRSTFRVQIR